MKILRMRPCTLISVPKIFFLSIYKTCEPGSSVSIVSGYMMFWELAVLPFSDGIQLYWKVFHSLFSVLVDNIGETGLSLYSVWLRAGQPGDRRSIPGRGEKDFSSSLCVQTGSEAHPASCTMGTGGPFLGARWVGAIPTLPQASLWRVLGQL
jgi:hypothetical protein